MNIKNILKTSAFLVLLALVFSSCGNGFLNVDFEGGPSDEDALDNLSHMKAAVTGDYVDFGSYQFCGNWAISAGDIATDLASLGKGGSGWVQDVYGYASLTDQDPTMLAIWQYGYKTVNLSARIIEAADKLDPQQKTNEDKMTLNLYRAETLGLRAAAYLYLMNYFALPYKVQSNPSIDNGDQLGLVLEDKPVKVGQHVTRSTIKETYDAILADLAKADELFTDIDKNGASVKSRGVAYINHAAIKGFLARTYLYLEKYDDAEKCAKEAYELAGSPSIVSDSLKYDQVYSTLASPGGEGIFNLEYDATSSLSSYSPGTLWTSYKYSPGYNFLQKLSPKDIRHGLVAYDTNTGLYLGGKYYGLNGNSEVASMRIMNAPEMFLIQAEAELLKNGGDMSKAIDLVFTVANARNHDLKKSDIGSTKDAVFKFIKDERARELFQEGHRFQDDRRWGDIIEVAQRTDKDYQYKKFNASAFCYPIPLTEIHSGMGVQQNPNWASYKPKE